MFENSTIEDPILSSQKQKNSSPDLFSLHRAILNLEIQKNISEMISLKIPEFSLLTEEEKARMIQCFKLGYIAAKFAAADLVF